MKNIRLLLPKWLKMFIKNLRLFLLKGLYYFEKNHKCPICNNSFRKFASFGPSWRKNAQCVYCETLERHRFLWLFFQKNTDLFNGKDKTILHIAPEKGIESRIRTMPNITYITADLLNPHAMVKMDITDIQYPDESFDIIWCNHVLEHVQEDRKAIKNIFRVLKKDGWAILNVPIRDQKTVEDPSIITPEDRLKIFGQDDHVRIYGTDYIDRLHEAGFKVDVFKVNDIVNNIEAEFMGLADEDGEIYYCTK